ncbi:MULTISPECIES: ChrR family anti-sigma-E factor [Shimia]|uniref:ChrR family anti-sigma-E factor n=1 Tax=Shimia TaxID=573139 RepID=UPI001FB1AC1F|nr:MULTISPECIES: ChrR family anti-sigma-E factor [Shimia]MDV4144227.1 ChrR family anti-sigma-E factor [Shimia sp. FJ5]
MTEIAHHIPDEILVAYAAGTLPQAHAVVVAAHISLCAECRAALAAHEAVGGALLEVEKEEAVSEDLRNRLFDMLDAPAPVEPAPPRRNGIYPGPVAALLGPDGQAPWKSLGFGVKQAILRDTSEDSLRLLYIPAGRAMPEHGHNGLEMTLVLQGSFSDEEGRFGRGDVEIGHDALEHTPVADPGPDCICLAATDARLRFKSLVPRLLQPFFRI